MKEMSVFDIIGPNMIGPSSSHTAGALRIALLAGKMVKDPITDVRFVLYGSFAQTYQGHGTDKALLAGILGFDTEDHRIRNSFKHALEAGITYSFDSGIGDDTLHPNTVDIVITDRNGHITSIQGESIGGGAAVIRRINGVEISLSGEYNTIFVTHKDAKGVLAFIAKCISDSDINIAYTKVYRESKGEIAYTVIETDEPIPSEVITLIESAEAVESAVLIELQ